MHYIQKYILDELRSVESKRYAQLMRDDVESGHFRYHLQELIKDGLVTQLERGLYALSQHGQQFVDKLSVKRINPMAMPKVITYTLLRDNQAVLLQEKTKQPYLHLYNMIGGKLHLGETSRDAAVREVYEKTGRRIAAPDLAGIFEIMIHTDESLLTHVIAYVYSYQIKASDDFSTAGLWRFTEDDLSKSITLAPDFIAIYQRLQQGEGVQSGILELHT